MRADNSHHVVAAAHRRAAGTRERAVTALRRMDKAGLPVTFEALAQQAQVSRSWLYNQPDLRAEVERLRARRRPPSPPRPVPDRQRASHASLLQRLQTAALRIRRLECSRTGPTSSGRARRCRSGSRSGEPIGTGGLFRVEGLPAYNVPNGSGDLEAYLARAVCLTMLSLVVTHSKMHNLNHD